MIAPSTPDRSPRRPGTAGHGLLSGWSRRALAWLGVHEGEERAAWALFGFFLLLETCHYISKSVRQATYIDTLGAERLPWVYLLLTATSVPVLFAYSRLARGRPLHRLVAATSAVQGLAMVAFYLLFATGEAWVALVFYLWITTAFGIAISQFWLYSAQVFDPRQARRLFAFVCAGGLLGGLTGGQLARVTAGAFGTRAGLLVAASLMVLLTVALQRWRSRPQGPPPSERPAVAEGTLEEARGGFRALVGSRLLVLIAAVMFMTMVVSQVVDVQFNWVVEKTTDGLDRRTALFGNFFSVMGVLAFAFQVVATRWIHRVLGVGFAMRVMPVTVGAGSVALLVASGLGAGPMLLAGGFLKLGESGLRHSLEQSTRELLFFPVPPALRQRAKAYLDVFVQRFAEGASALALLTVTFGLVAVEDLSWLTLGLVVVWIGVTVLARREYVEAFRQGLESGTVHADAAIDLEDVTTVTSLVTSLGSPDPRQVETAIDLLAMHGRGRLVPPLLLYHDEAAVRLRTLDLIAGLGRLDASPLVERRLADPDPEVRSAAVRALAHLQGRDACDLMAPRLGDADPRVRAAAVVCLAQYGSSELAADADRALAAMIADDRDAVRLEACRALGQLPMPSRQDELVQLLYDRSTEVVRGAIAAVRQRTRRDGPNPIYLPLLIALLRDRHLKHDARSALHAYGPRAVAALTLFMHERQEQIQVRRAVPKTIARIGGPEAAAALVEGLRLTDSVIRREIVEALVYLVSREPGLALDRQPVREAITVDAGRALQTLADLVAVGGAAAGEGPIPAPENAEEPLLEALLRETMAHHVSSLFGLLELLHPAADVRAAHRSLSSPDRTLRAHALEFLDNTVGGRVRRDLFAVIDDLPAEWKLRQGEALYGTVVGTRRDTILRLMTAASDDNPAAADMVVAALEAAAAESDHGLTSVAAELARKAADPVVRETAAWVARRRYVGDAEGSEMAAMARIEKVLALREVDLLGSCSAEQILELAAIASELPIAAGGAVYRPGEPAAALFCVVEGRVRVADTTVEAGGSFGVVDILSGRLRTASAVAAEDSRLLAIASDDFFDLLSNNVEIVKALFRRIASASAEASPMGGLR